jgi:hypothetical protein
MLKTVTARHVKVGECRRPYLPSAIPRIDWMQQWHCLCDPVTEYKLYGIAPNAMRRGLASWLGSLSPPSQGTAQIYLQSAMINSWMDAENCC